MLDVLRTISSEMWRLYSYRSIYVHSYIIQGFLFYSGFQTFPRVTVDWFGEIVSFCRIILFTLIILREICFVSATILSERLKTCFVINSFGVCISSWVPHHNFHSFPSPTNVVRGGDQLQTWWRSWGPFHRPEIVDICECRGLTLATNTSLHRFGGLWRERLHSLRVYSTVLFVHLAFLLII